MPDHAPRQTNAHPLPREPAQAVRLRSPGVEPRQIRGHVEELQLRLLAVGLRGLQKNHGRGPQVEGVDPGAARVVVEEHDAPGHRLALQADAVAAVDQLPLQTAGRQGRRAHQVGPHSEEPQGLSPRLEPEPLVHRHGNGELVAVDLPDAHGRELGGEPVRGLDDSGIAGHPRLGGGEGGHGAPEPLFQLRRRRGSGGGRGGQQRREEEEREEGGERRHVLVTTRLDTYFRARNGVVPLHPGSARDLKNMGTFTVPLEVADPRSRRYETVAALVDSGATCTALPVSMLQRLGVVAHGARRFVLADGRRLELGFGRTWIRHRRPQGDLAGCLAGGRHTTAAGCRYPGDIRPGYRPCAGAAHSGGRLHAGDGGGVHSRRSNRMTSGSDRKQPLGTDSFGGQAQADHWTPHPAAAC